MRDRIARQVWSIGRYHTPDFRHSRHAVNGNSLRLFGGGLIVPLVRKRTKLGVRTQSREFI